MWESSFRDALLRAYSMTETEIREEAYKIREILISKPFAECYPLTKDFKQLPTSPGTYALKSRDEEILYIGKSGGIRARFRSGHNALTQAFFDDCRIDSPGVLREQNKILKIQLAAAQTKLGSVG